MKVNIDGERMEFRIDNVQVFGQDVVIEGLHTASEVTSGGVRRITRSTITLTMDELSSIIDPVITQAAAELESAPDKNCISTADGGCVGGVGAGLAPCMHDPRG